MANLDSPNWGKEDSRKENRKMKKKLIPLVALLVICVVPAMALGASVEGTIQGFNCVTQGKVCPIGKEDPMVAAEKLFVLHTGGSSYHFLPNIDRAVLARQLNKTVKVEGRKDSKFNSISAKDLYVMRKGTWKKVWSSNAKDEIYKGLDLERGGFPVTGWR